MPVLRKIVYGGQTGADRAGLDFAIEVGLAHGGYVPKGRKAEDGRIDENMPSSNCRAAHTRSEQDVMFGRAMERLS
jgi:hypothetical protein